MAFNLGAFAGGLVSGGLKTYQTITEMERQKAIEARDAERFEFERQRAAEEERLRKSAKEAETLTAQSTLPTTGGVPLSDVIKSAVPFVSNSERAGGAGAAKTDVPMSEEARQALQAKIEAMPFQEQAKAVQAYGSVKLPLANQDRAGGAGGAESALPLANAVTYKDENGKTFVAQAVTDEATIVANMKQRAYASGNPIAIKQANDMEAQVLQKTQVRQAIQLGSKQLLSADRAERDAQKVEDFNNWHTDILGKAQEDPMKAAQAMVVEYNTGAQHQDGRTAKIIDAPATGTDSTAPAKKLMVFINDKTGEQIGNAVPITPETVQQGIEQLAFQKWKTLPGNFKDGLAQQNKEKELANQTRQVTAAEKSAEASVTSAQAAATKAQAEVDLVKAQIAAGIPGAEAAHKKAQAAQATAMGDYYKSLRTAADDDRSTNKQATDAMKPFLTAYAALSPEDQISPKGQALLDKAAAASIVDAKGAAQVITALKRPDKSGIEADWAAVEKSMYANGTPPADVAVARNSFFAQRGYAPSAASQAVLSGKGPDGKPLTEADVDSFNVQFPNSKVDKSKLPWLKSGAKVDTTTTTTPPAGGTKVQEAIETAKKPVDNAAGVQNALATQKLIDNDPTIKNAQAVIKNLMQKGGTANVARATEMQTKLDAYIANLYKTPKAAPAAPAAPAAAIPVAPAAAAPAAAPTAAIPQNAKVQAENLWNDMDIQKSRLDRDPSNWALKEKYKAAKEKYESFKKANNLP